jgi:hypothetical protein
MVSVVSSIQIRSLPVDVNLKGTASPRQVIYGVTHESRLVVGPIPFMLARAGSVTDLERSLS